MPKLKLKGGISPNLIPKLDTTGVVISHRTILNFPTFEITSTDNEYIKKYATEYFKKPYKNAELNNLINYLKEDDLDLNTIDDLLKKLLSPEEQALADEAVKKAEADAKAKAEAEAEAKAAVERAAAAEAAAEAERAAAEAKQKEADAQEAARLAALAVEQAKEQAAAQEAAAQAEAERVRVEGLAAEAERLKAAAALLEKERLEEEKRVEAERLKAKAAAEAQAEAERLKEEKRVEAARLESDRLEKEAKAKATAKVAKDKREAQEKAKRELEQQWDQLRSKKEEKEKAKKEAKEAEIAQQALLAEKEAEQIAQKEAEAAKAAQLAEQAAILAREQSEAAAKQALLDKENRIKAEAEAEAGAKAERDAKAEAVRIKAEEEKRKRNDEEAARIARETAEQAARVEEESAKQREKVADDERKAEEAARRLKKEEEEANILKLKNESDKAAALVKEAGAKAEEARRTAKEAGDVNDDLLTKQAQEIIDAASEAEKILYPPKITEQLQKLIEEYTKKMDIDEKENISEGANDSLYLSNFTKKIRELYQTHVDLSKKYNPQVYNSKEFGIKINTIQKIYYRLYKSKYNDLLRAATLFHKIKKPPDLKFTILEWFKSSLKVADEYRKFLDQMKALLPLQNTAPPPVEIPLFSRPTQALSQFSTKGFKGVKNVYTQKEYQNSLNSQLFDNLQLETKMYESKIKNIEEKGLFIFQLAKSDKEQSIKDIASGVLNYDPNPEKNLYLKFEEYLSEYVTKKQKEQADFNLSTGLLKDIKLWVKFSSLSLQPPP